jgi:hypothetical protein
VHRKAQAASKPHAAVVTSDQQYRHTIQIPTSSRFVPRAKSSALPTKAHGNQEGGSPPLLAAVVFTTEGDPDGIVQSSKLSDYA